MRQLQRQTSEILICPVCDNIQLENSLAENDKFAWQCTKCERVIENGKPHLLEDIAVFTDFPRGNVCTGFGGLVGQIYHKTSK